MASNHRPASIDPLCHLEESPILASLGMIEIGGHPSDDAISRWRADRAVCAASIKVLVEIEGLGASDAYCPTVDVRDGRACLEQHGAVRENHRLEVGSSAR